MTPDEIRALALSESEIDAIVVSVLATRGSVALRLRDLVPAERIVTALADEAKKPRQRSHGEAFADALDALDHERELERVRSGSDDDDLF